jgi:hypothetical protein
MTAFVCGTCWMPQLRRRVSSGPGSGQISKPTGCSRWRWSRIEIIGEAASRISEEFKTSQPQVPWSKAIGMRHRLVHAYFEIDFDILWTTVTDALPRLIAALEHLLAETE